MPASASVLPADPGVLDLVVQRLDLVASAVERRSRFTWSATSAKGLMVDGVMLFTRTRTGPNWRLQHPRHAARGKREHGVRLGLVDHRVLGRLADVGVLGFKAARLDDVVEARAALDLGLSRLGVGLVGEQDLFERALFGRAEARVLARVFS